MRPLPRAEHVQLHAARRCRGPVVVATAAPVTPSRGNGPSPKMKHGSRQMLMALAIHSTRIATAASPAPRNTALIRNSIRMTPLKPRTIAANDECARTSGGAPISASSGPREPEAGEAERHRDENAERNRLNRRDRGAVRIALADAARDGRRRAHAQADRHRVDDRQHRLGEADGRDRVGAEAARRRRRRRPRTPTRARARASSGSRAAGSRGRSEPSVYSP